MLDLNDQFPNTADFYPLFESYYYLSVSAAKLSLRHRYHAMPPNAKNSTFQFGLKENGSSIKSLSM